MKIDLSNKIQCFLVQEYVNRICHYESEEELNWNVHKLIHTFQVVQMAQKLIDRTKEKLSKKQKKEIINASILHDLGRCYEFKKGKHLKFVDHGKIGGRLILKKFPNLLVEAKTTQFHNKIPSSKDPKICAGVLDYVRDADMLANLQYNVEHFNVFVQHIFLNKFRKIRGSNIDREIINSLKEKRSVNIKALKENTVLTLFLWQLCWFFNLRTQVGIELAKKEKLFLKYRECICDRLLPLLDMSPKEQDKVSCDIRTIFPDKMFL